MHEYGWLFKAIVIGIVVGVVAFLVVLFLIKVTFTYQPGDDPRVIQTTSEAEVNSMGDISE